MYRSILVPLDGSAFSEHALPLALSLARRADAQVHLAHVHVEPSPLLTRVHDSEMRAAEQMYLEGIVQRIEATWNVPLTTIMLDGPIVQQLHSYMTDSAADLVVMTTHGRGPITRFWLGSVADALIRQTSVPVLLVRPRDQLLDLVHEPSINRMLVPLDGSSLAEQVLPYASALGRLTDAEYTLLQAVELPIIAYSTEVPTVVMDSMTPEALREYAQNYLDTVADRLRGQGLRVQTATMINQAAASILTYAQEHAIDMIALETHGRTGLARWILGAVADKVIRGATVPVLVHTPQSVHVAA